MNLTIDKPQVFESDTVDSVDLDNVTFEVNPTGHLIILADSSKEMVGYFPKDKCDCVYRRVD